MVRQKISQATENLSTLFFMLALVVKQKDTSLLNPICEEKDFGRFFVFLGRCKPPVLELSKDGDKFFVGAAVTLLFRGRLF